MECKYIELRFYRSYCEGSRYWCDGVRLHVIIYFQGVLDHITPYKVFARDGDLGIGARINYSIEYGNSIYDYLTFEIQYRCFIVQ